MASSLKLSKFLFKAEIGELSLNTSVQCDLSATWKRSNELAKSGLVSLVAGKASFNQTLTLPINMYFDSATNSFQEKKVDPSSLSLSSASLSTPTRGISRQGW